MTAGIKMRTKRGRTEKKNMAAKQARGVLGIQGVRWVGRENK